MNSTLPSHWSWVKLGDIVTKIPITGKKLKQKEYLHEGKYPVIDQGQDLIGGYTNEENLLIDCELPVIVFGDHTKIKKFINFKFVPGADGVKVIKPSKKYNEKLFYYFLHCIKIPNKGYARHFQFVEKAEIPLPPLPEQKKIVAKIEELFSELDNGIEQLKKAKEQLQIYRQAVLNYAFTGRLCKNLIHQIPTNQIPTNQIPTKTKTLKAAEPEIKYGNNELPSDLPESWKCVKLGDVIKVSSGKSLTNARMIKNGKYSVYGGNGISGYYNQFLFKEPRLIIGRVGAKCGVMHITKPKSWVTDNALVVEFVTKNVDIKFLYYCLGYHNLNKLSVSTAQPVISGAKIYPYKIMLPPFSVQHQIVSEIESRFSVADKLEQTIDENLTKSEKLRQSILKQAFEGKL